MDFEKLIGARQMKQQKINLSRALYKMETMDMTSKKSKKKKKKKKKKKTKKAAACSAADLMEQLAVVQKKEGQETAHVCVRVASFNRNGLCRAFFCSVPWQVANINPKRRNQW